MAQLCPTCCDPSTSGSWVCQVRTLPSVSTPRPATYSYDELADRIEEVLGERPSNSALRAAPAQSRRTTSTLSKPRLTVGMPAPLPATSRTAPATFSAKDVEAWLAQHPRLAYNEAVLQARSGLNDGSPVEEVLAQALRNGLSWRTITSLLVEHDGQARSTTAVHKRYRHLAQRPN